MIRRCVSFEITTNRLKDEPGPVYGLIEMLADLGAISNFKCEMVLEDEPVMGTGTCDTCGKRYESLFGDEFQCDGMAARVTQDGRIVGSYGSYEIDMQIWKLCGRRENYPHIKNGNICDACIKHLKATNEIFLVQDGYLG